MIQALLSALRTGQHPPACSGGTAHAGKRNRCSDQCTGDPFGAILGGLLFSLLPFSLLLNIAATAFFLSAILECIMRIPFQSAPSGGRMLAVIRTDMKESLHFLRYENPALIRLFAAVGSPQSCFVQLYHGGPSCDFQYHPCPVPCLLRLAGGRNRYWLHRRQHDSTLCYETGGIYPEPGGF